MIHRQPVILAVVLLILAAAPQGGGVAQTPLATLFEGEPGDVRTVSIGSWGGAECTESTTDAVLVGTMSIRLHTSNAFRGGRVGFLKPVDLGAAMQNRSAYLRFVVYSSGRAQKTDVSLTDPRSSGGPYGPSGPYGPKGGVPVTATAQELGYSPITEIRAILFFEEGTLVVDRQKVEPYRQDEGGWSRFNVPLAKFRSQGELPGYHLKRLVICGDKDDTLYIGEIQVIKDDTPIIVGVGEDYEIWKGTPIGMMAVADGGAAALEYSWDFDASDGITEDATGPIGQHTYPEPGDYTVTITVRDVDGIKPPQKIENTVHVVSG